jgi:hypothetical protein
MAVYIFSAFSASTNAFEFFHPTEQVLFPASLLVLYDRGLYYLRVRLLYGNGLQHISLDFAYYVVISELFAQLEAFDNTLAYALVADRCRTCIDVGIFDVA